MTYNKHVQKGCIGVHYISLVVEYIIYDNITFASMDLNVLCKARHWMEGGSLMSCEALPMAKRLASAAFIVGMVATSAEGALLTNIQGAVFVNSGNGFIPVTAGTSVNPGARIRVGAGAAEIFYENGCSQKVGSDQMVMVPSAPPCAGSLKDGGDTAAVASSDFTLPDTVTAGALLAAGAGLAIGIANEGSNESSNEIRRSVSP